MTITDSSRFHASDCVLFEAQLGAWLEHDLDTRAQQWMTTHRQDCKACAQLVTDLEAVIMSASTLPPLPVPAGLWQRVAPRLDTPVIPLASSRVPAASRYRAVPLRWFAMAATLLVAASAATTWQIARGGLGRTPTTSAVRAIPQQMDDQTRTVAIVPPSSEGAPFVSTDPPTLPSTAPEPIADRHAAGTSSIARLPAATPVTNAGDGYPDLALTYEREIVALRHIVNAQFRDLDSGTVAVLRRNLNIIDQAILDSRKALARDPHSAGLAVQLDRALEAKLSLMRRVALL